MLFMITSWYINILQVILDDVITYDYIRDYLLFFIKDSKITDYFSSHINKLQIQWNYIIIKSHH